MHYKPECDSWIVDRPQPLPGGLRRRLAGCRILGLGAHLPGGVLTNEELAERFGVTPDWIHSRTGIRSRAVLEPGRDASDMGAAAAAQAIERAGMFPEEVTHLLLASCAPDGLMPNTACAVARKLGLTGLAAMDVNAACSGFVYGLYLAAGVLCLEPEAKVLLVATEAMTRMCSPNNLHVRVLFGDGAGAALLAREQGVGLDAEDVWVTSDPRYGDLLTSGGAGSRSGLRPGDTVGEDYFVRMQGREVFRHAVRGMAESSRLMLARNGLEARDVDLFVPHQANGRIIAAVAEQLGLDMDRVMVNLGETGNTSGASIPIALSQAWEEGRLRPGRRVLATAFGGGFTWGSALLRCC